MTAALKRMGMLFLFLAAMAGCSSEVTRQVGGHEFKIPREYLVQATVFYLPTSQSRGLRFVVNPGAPLQHQHMVSIDPSASCPSLKSYEPPDPRCRVVPTSLDKLVREPIRRVGDKIWWDYQFEEGGQLVAFCSALGDGEGLCTHHGLYGDLPYAVGLRDSEMPKLVAIRKMIEQKLAEWEAAAGASQKVRGHNSN